MSGQAAAEVPPFSVTELAPRRTRYCYVPVVYLEGQRFIDQLEKTRPLSGLADIMVAERRSTDGSTDPDLLRRMGVRALLTTDQPGGAAAIRMAFAHALAEGYEGVILTDGNGKDDPSALPDFIAKLEAGFDFVQGSRFMPGGVERNTPLLRLVGIKAVMRPLLWLGGGLAYSDPTNGFRGYSRRFLTDDRVQPLRSCFVHFNLQYYLSAMAPALGFKVVEIPVSRVYPDDGTVPTKVRGLRRNFQALWEMVLTSAGRYRPG